MALLVENYKGRENIDKGKVLIHPENIDQRSELTKLDSGGLINFLIKKHEENLW